VSAGLFFCRLLAHETKKSKPAIGIEELVSVDVYLLR